MLHATNSPIPSFVPGPLEPPVPTPIVPDEPGFEPVPIIDPPATVLPVKGPPDLQPTTSG